MKPRFTFKYFIAFFSLVFVLHELHDWAHAGMGRLVCDCWGTKAFDTWNFCDKCNLTVLETFFCWIAGPLVTYLFIWLAFWLMHPFSTSSDKSLGFSIYFAALPFGRIFSAALGDGDETNSLRILFPAANGGTLSWVSVAGFILVIVLTLPGFLRAARLLPNWKQQLIYLSALLIIPFAVDRLVVTQLMNKLLAKGVLEEEGLPGTPILVTIWVFLMILTLMVTYRKLLHLFKKKKKKKEDIFSSAVDA